MFTHKSYLVLGEFTGFNFETLVKSGYELADCEYSFRQGIDNTGKAATEVFAGSINATLQTLPTQAIIDWAMKSTKYHNGAIIFLDEHNDPQEKVLFENAACLKMQINYTLQGESYITTDLMIQAEYLTFDNGIRISNEWT